MCGGRKWYKGYKEKIVHEAWDWHPYEDKFAIGGYIETGTIFGGSDANKAVIMVYDSKSDSSGPRMVSVVKEFLSGSDTAGVAVGVKAI